MAVEQYGIKEMKDLETASPYNLKNDYFIITRQNGTEYTSYKTTLNEISSALCSVIGSQMNIPKYTIESNQLSDVIVHSMAELNSKGQPGKFIGSGTLLKEINSIINTKQPIVSPGSSTTINGTYIFNSCPKTSCDPIDDDDLVRLGYLESILNQVYCDANNCEEIFSAPVLNTGTPDVIAQNESCPVIIQNDTDGQVLINIEGASSAIGIYLFNNPTRSDYQTYIRGISDNDTNLKSHFEEFTLLNTDAASGQSFNTMLPIKGGQVICIFPKIQRITVKYSYLGWKSLGTSTSAQQKYVNEYASYPEIGTYTYKDFTVNKKTIMTKREIGNNAKFRVYYDNNPTKLRYQYVTYELKTNVKKIIPKHAYFPLGTNITLTRFS